jgi:hypothetical protein
MNSYNVYYDYDIKFNKILINNNVHFINLKKFKII